MDNFNDILSGDILSEEEELFEEPSPVDIYDEKGHFIPEFLEDIYSRNFSVVIASDNGFENLMVSLPPLFEALDEYEEGEVQVIFVFNKGNAESIKLINENYDEAKIVISEEEKGFPGLLNLGISQAEYPLVFIMQDDVIVENGFMRSLLEYFDDEIFAVVPRILLETDNNSVKSLHLLKFNDGDIIHEELSDGKFAEPVYIPGICAAASMFKRGVYFELGGFDDLYEPDFGFDLDLGYRAWKRGHKVAYSRRSTVHHRGVRHFENQLKNPEITQLRNHLIFCCKNLTNSKMHRKFLSGVWKKNLLHTLGIKKNPVHHKAWKELKKKGRTLAGLRKKEVQSYLYDDPDLISMFSSHPVNRLGLK